MGQEKVDIIEAKASLINYSKGEKYNLFRDNYDNSYTQNIISMLFTTNRNDGADARMLTYFHVNGWTINKVMAEGNTFFVEMIKDKEPLISRIITGIKKK
ncbi:hypothetical protein [Leuconostoc citreum]|uniref:hypothetical protein n=1 Tax=Leuconostoc citreum TaxID=33964 RepID=UPI0032E00BBB